MDNDEKFKIPRNRYKWYTHFFAVLICLFLKSSFHFKCKKLNKTLKSYSNDSANLISGLWVISFRFFWGLTHFSSFSHQCFESINRWVITLITSVRNNSFHVWLYQSKSPPISKSNIGVSRKKLFMIISLSNDSIIFDYQFR